MVRPERRVVPGGASPVRVSAGAPGSRLQPGGEILTSRAECQEPPYQRGATGGPQQSVNALASTNCQPKDVWEGRAAHVTAKARDCMLGTGTNAGPPRVVAGGGTLGQSNAEQERPYLAAESKQRPGVWRPEGPESVRSQEGVRGRSKVPGSGAQQNALEGRGLALIEPGGEVSARSMPETDNTPKEKSTTTPRQAKCVCQAEVRRGASMRCTTGSTGVTSCGKHGKRVRSKRRRGRDRCGDNPGYRTTRARGVSSGDSASVTGRPISSFPGEAAIHTESRWEAAAIGDTDGAGTGWCRWTKIVDRAHFRAGLPVEQQLWIPAEEERNKPWKRYE